MAIYRNVASQKIAVFAWDTSANAEKTGDAANITARISKDGAAVAQTNDVNPTELDVTYAPGVYLFDLTQAESNCDLLTLFAKSGTANIKLEPVIIYTLPTWQASQVAQTGDAFTRLGAPVLTSVSADVAAIYATVDTEIATLISNVATILAAVDTEVGALPTADAIKTAIFAGLMEARSFEEIIKDIWAQTAGDAVADDSDEPTSIVYEGPNGATQVTHTLTSTTRVRS